ncbi:MAG: AAA family ATPase, partial [Gammaproteobacteria bacterium]|nr:AAA family ATPase [Gammaproteobacteria bacterium]
LAFILQLNTLTYNETRFRFVIFADPGINAVLDDPRIKVATTGIIHSINIPLLTEAQTSAYLEYRLQAAGKINQYPFTDKDSNNIYKVSGGAPGKIISPDRCCGTRRY